MGSRMPPFLLWSLLFLEAGNLLSVSLEQKYLVQPCWRYLKNGKKRNMSIHSRKLFLVNLLLLHATNTLFSCLFEKKTRGKIGKLNSSHMTLWYFSHIFRHVYCNFFFYHRKKNLLSVHSSFCLYDILQAMRNIRHFPIVIPKQ